MTALLAARDLIQSGWLLLHHPLYGNFRPHQQPYRSLILRFNPDSVRLEDGLERILPDEYSLHLIEEAVGLYRTVTVLTPERAPAAFRDDCAFLDYELMRLPLEQAGWPVAMPVDR